jgi:hypothetical protein
MRDVQDELTKLRWEEGRQGRRLNIFKRVGIILNTFLQIDNGKHRRKKKIALTRQRDDNRPRKPKKLHTYVLCS